MFLECKYITPAQHSLAMRSLMVVGNNRPRECTLEEMQDRSTLGMLWELPSPLIELCAPL